jgi:hypothetical protein
MFGAGIYLSKYPPKEINAFLGYRTKKACKNKDTWDFAQKKSGNYFMILSAINLVIFLTLTVAFKNQEFYKTYMMIGTHIQILGLLLPIVFTEYSLKKFMLNGGSNK